jgi:hypothetical protein
MTHGAHAGFPHFGQIVAAFSVSMLMKSEFGR